MAGITSAAWTDQGKVRVRNEDAFINFPDQRLWCVADGMGGHKDGHIASRMIIEALSDLQLSDCFKERTNQVRQCLHQVNQKLSQTRTLVFGEPPSTIGSTVVVLLLDTQRMTCIWAGDSRCYLLREKKIYQVTKDHAIWQELVEEQKLSPQEAQAQKGSHALTRAIGVNPDLKLEMIEMEIYEDDCFLLCTDGVYQHITYDQLYYALNRASAKSAIEQLVHDVLATEATDNLTAIVIKQ